MVASSIKTSILRMAKKLQSETEKNHLLEMVIIIVIVIGTLRSAISCEPPQMCQAQVCIWAYTVLPATRRLNPIGKDSSPITTQSSRAVTHCILAAPQFIYPKGMEGSVNQSAPGIKPGPYCVVTAVGGRSTD
jgi:hypothetical protein